MTASGTDYLFLFFLTYIKTDFVTYSISLSILFTANSVIKKGCPEAVRDHTKGSRKAAEVEHYPTYCFK